LGGVIAKNAFFCHGSNLIVADKVLFMASSPSTPTNIAARVSGLKPSQGFAIMLDPLKSKLIRGKATLEE
jgi:hypothetical protein